MKFRHCAAAIGLVAILASGAATAEQKPLWEFGMGAGALAFPDYRGSDESEVYPVPVPYFLYRGDIFKADGDGARAELLDRKHAELSISVNATIPVDSEDNAARRGMSNLRSTVELGPSLDLHAWRSKDGRMKLDVVMPLRAPVTVESSPRSIGWVFAPRVNLDVGDVAGLPGWNFGVGAGPLFADRKFHRYFYSVAPRFATPQRPEYQAGGGYSGMQFMAAVSKRYPDFWVGAYVRYDALSGAAFDDSPLVRSKNYIAGGLGFAWMIKQSSRLVETNDE